MPPVPRHRARKGLPKPDHRRRALELLAASRDGVTEAIMLAHGFTVPLMVELVRAGLVSVGAERMVAGGKTIEIATVRITEAGRGALAEDER
jgi:hypothetical protein